jgi:F-type H+-transporting ATPase subunit epsilon
MANALTFTLISPEKVLAELTAASVQLPATEGEMGVLPDHAPVITSLSDGIVAVTGVGGQVSRFTVAGGFAEVTDDAVIVLADTAAAA